MKIIQVISEHKKNRRNQVDKDLWHSRLGWGECIVEENGKLVTRHLPLRK